MNVFSFLKCYFSWQMSKAKYERTKTIHKHRKLAGLIINIKNFLLVICLFWSFSLCGQNDDLKITNAENDLSRKQVKITYDILVKKVKGVKLRVFYSGIEVSNPTVSFESNDFNKGTDKVLYWDVRNDDVFANTDFRFELTAIKDLEKYFSPFERAIYISPTLALNKAALIKDAEGNFTKFVNLVGLNVEYLTQDAEVSYFGEYLYGQKAISADIDLGYGKMRHDISLSSKIITLGCLMHMAEIDYWKRLYVSGGVGIGWSRSINQIILEGTNMRLPEKIITDTFLIGVPIQMKSEYLFEKFSLSINYRGFLNMMWIGGFGDGDYNNLFLYNRRSFHTISCSFSFSL